MIRFRCSCGRGFELADDKAGKKGKCPVCGAVNLISPAPVEAVFPTLNTEDDGLPEAPVDPAAGMAPTAGQKASMLAVGVITVGGCSLLTAFLIFARLGTPDPPPGLAAEVAAAVGTPLGDVTVESFRAAMRDRDPATLLASNKAGACCGSTR